MVNLQEPTSRKKIMRLYQIFRAWFWHYWYGFFPENDPLLSKESGASVAEKEFVANRNKPGYCAVVPYSTTIRQFSMTADIYEQTRQLHELQQAAIRRGELKKQEMIQKLEMKKKMEFEEPILEAQKNIYEIL